MKNILLMVILLGLAGCGNNQSDSSRTDALPKAEVEQAVESQRLAASPRVLSLVAPLQQWNLLSNAVLGAETIIEALNGQLVSNAAIRPNAKQVAEVLRGGAAGVALTIAVDQLLGAVDWILDPENNQIKYKLQTNASCKYLYSYLKLYTCDMTAISKAANDYYKSIGISNPQCTARLQQGSYNAEIECIGLGGIVANLDAIINTKYNPASDFRSIQLDVVAEKVISNADEGSLDAQVATNIAAQNILNDTEQAQPVVQELEENAKYAGVATRPNDISHERENEILNMTPNDPCDEISQAIKDLDETIEWRKSDLNPAEKGTRVYVNHQKRIRILSDKKDEMNRAYRIWCESN